MHSIAATQLAAYVFFFVFFLNDTATTEIYTLSLHDALPIYARIGGARRRALHRVIARAHLDQGRLGAAAPHYADRKSTRLNSSHVKISYAVFCLKKKKKTRVTIEERSHRLLHANAQGAYFGS